MKTAFKALIIALLAFSILTACASTEPEVFDVEFSVKNDRTDLEGVTVKYYRPTSGQGSGSYYVADQVLGYETGTILGDLAMKRIKDVQNELNCVLDITYFGDSDNMYQVFNMNSASGTYMCDAICGISDQFRDAMKAGTLVGLSELEGLLDYRNEDKWGRRNILESLYWEDDAYGLIPMSWPASSVSYQGLTIVNEDLIASLGETDPRDYYENKQWTWETYRGCLERYYAQEGSEVKHYAITHQYLGDIARCFMISNGYRLAEKGTDGEYHSGLSEPYVLTAMNEANDIAFGPLSYAVSVNVNHIDAITNGETVMCVLHQAEYLNDIVKEMTNFGVIAFPSGPDVEPGFAAVTTMNLERVIVLSRFSHNIDATAIVLDRLYDPFEEYPDNEAIKDFLFQTYFFDRRDADIYYEMYLNSQFSYFASAPWHTLSEWIEGRRAPTEYIESVMDKVEEYIEEEIAPSKRGIEAVWGED